MFYYLMGVLIWIGIFNIINHVRPTPDSEIKEDGHIARTDARLMYAFMWPVGFPITLVVLILLEFEKCFDALNENI